MDFIIRLAEEFFKKHKRLARYRRIFAFLAAVVVFATTYELILPAITMDRQRAFQSSGVEVGVAKNQREGIEFTEDDPFAAGSAGEDAFEAGFPEDGDFFEDDAGAAGDGYAEDFAADGTGSSDDWMQTENPGAGDTWGSADEIVPGADSTGDDYSGSDADGSLTDENGTGADTSAGDDLEGVPSSDSSNDSSNPENAGGDISAPENDGTDLSDGSGTDSEEAGLEGTGSASHGDSQDLETAEGEDSEDASDVSSENISGDNTQDASTGASTADSKETDDTTDNNSNKGDTASGSTAAGSTTAGSGEAVIEGSTAETAVEFARDGAAAGATDLAGLGATGETAIAVTYPATITFNGKDYTITATFDEKAKLPAEVTLNAVEILPDKVYKDENGNPLYADYEEYYQKTLEALEKENRLDKDQTVATARFFDITFLDKDGKTVEPAAPVSIAVKYKDALSAVDTADTMAVHFEDNKADNSADANKADSEDNIEIIDDKDKGDSNESKVKAPAEITVPEILDTKTEVKKKTIQEISFEAESFSVYGVIGTEVLTTDFLSADGKTYTVTVKCNKKAEIPANATLEVSEIPNEEDRFNEYVDQAVAALSEVDNGDLYMSSARLFDIKILVNGKEFEPKAPVEVKIAYKTPEEVSDTSTVNAVHFGKENTEVLDIETQGSEKQLDGISFTTDSFSIYAVVVFDTNEGTFEAEGQGYKVVVSYTGAARFPKGTRMTIREIEADSNEYLQLLGEAWSKINTEYFLNKEKIREMAENFSEADDTPLPDPIPLKNIDGVRFFDITFTYDGEEIEPCAPVQVQIDLDDGMQIYEHQGTEVVHFGGAGTEIIDGVDARLDGNDSLIGVAYSQSSFSPIGILTTSAAKEETANVAAKGEKSSFFQKIISSIMRWWQASAFSPMTVYAADSYAISEKEINGTLTFYDDAACTHEISSASSGTTVYFKVTPDPGYYFSSTTVTRVDEDPDTKVTVERLSSPSNVYSFTMPAYPVIVTGVFQPPPQAGKELIPNGDGTHTLNLSVKGSSADLSTAASTSKKVNVIVVMDRSTSMVRSQNNTTIYKEFTGTPASGTTYYGLVGGEYVELNRNNGSWTYTAPGLVEYATDRNRYVAAATTDTSGEQYANNGNRIYYHTNGGGHWSYSSYHSNRENRYNGTRYLIDNDATSDVYGLVNENMASLTYTEGAYYYQSNTAAHPYNSTVYTRSTVSRLAAEQQALDNMVDSLLSYNNPDIQGLNDVVEIEVISFATGRGDEDNNTANGGLNSGNSGSYYQWAGYNDTTSSTETGLSTSKTELMAAVNNNSTSSGTNWQEAMEYAHDEANRIHGLQPTEDVYILFLTDGEPTCHKGNYSVSGGDAYYASQLQYALQPAKDLVSESYTYPDDYADESLRGKATGKNNYLYGVFTYGSENGQGQNYLKQLVNFAYGYGTSNSLKSDDAEGYLAKYFFDAKDNASLLSAMDSFIAAVFSSLAYGNVNITDGVTIGGGTNSVTSSTLISGTAGGFEYTVKGPNQGVLYTVTATGSSDNPTVTFHVNGNDYPGLQNQKTIHITGDNPKTTDVVETEYDQQLTYWYFDETNYPNYKMCLATVDDDGLVHWDLTGIGTLQNNWTYVTSFEVWPNQAAYDYVAGLSNGISGFEWNTTNQVYDSEKGYYKNGTDYEYLVRYPRAGAAANDIAGSTYRVLTNYEQSMSYNVLSEVTTNGETQYTYGETASVDMTPPEPMALAGTSLTVSKDWIDTIDPEQLKDIIEADPDYGVVLKLKREGQLYKSFEFKPQLKEGSEDEYEWPAQSMSIAPGIMVTHNPGGDYPTIQMGGKTYYILNPGHKYTIEEEVEDHHFEFSADPYHPMLVDNEMTNVEFTYDEHGEIDTSKGATVLGDRPLTNFKGNNTIKGRLYVEKEAEVPAGAAGVNLKDTKFTIQVTLKDKNGALLSTPKKENGDYELEGLIYRILYGENHPETDEGWAAYNPEYDNYGRSEKKPVVNGIITESIYAGDKIYVGNIPAGSTYEVSEPDSTLPLGWRRVSIDYEDAAKKIEGNTEDDVTVKNTVPSFAVKILKTDQGTKPLPNAKFALYGKDYYDEEGKVNPNAVAIMTNLTSGSDGMVDLGYIGGGQYYLVETEAPAGFNRLTAPVSITVDGTSTAKKGDDPLYVTYSQSGNIASDDNSGVTITSEVDGDLITYTYTLQVTNSAGAVLPHTGGSGKSIYTLGGIFIMMTAAMMYVFRMRRRERRLR